MLETVYGYLSYLYLDVLFLQHLIITWPCDGKTLVPSVQSSQSFFQRPAEVEGKAE